MGIGTFRIGSTFIVTASGIGSWKIGTGFKIS